MQIELLASVFSRAEHQQLAIEAALVKPLLGYGRTPFTFLKIHLTLLTYALVVAVVHVARRYREARDRTNPPHANAAIAANLEMLDRATGTDPDYLRKLVQRFGLPPA